MSYIRQLMLKSRTKFILRSLLILPVIVLFLIGNKDVKKLLGTKYRVLGLAEGDSNIVVSAVSSNATKGIITHELHHAMYLIKSYVIDEPLAAAEEFYHDYCEHVLQSKIIYSEFLKTLVMDSIKNYDVNNLLSAIERDIDEYDQRGETIDSYLASARIASRIYSIFGCNKKKVDYFFVYLGIGCKPRMANVAVHNEAIGSIIYSTHRASSLDFFHSLSLLQNPVYDGFIGDLYEMQILSNRRGVLFAPIDLHREYINGFLKGTHHGYVLELGVSTQHYWANKKGESKKIILMQDSFLDNGHNKNDLSPSIRYKKILNTSRKSSSSKRENFWVYPGLHKIIIDTATVDSVLSTRVVDILMDMESRSIFFSNNKRKIEYSGMRWTQVDSGAMVVRVIDEMPWEVRVELIKEYTGVVIKSIVVFNKDVQYTPLIENALWVASGLMVLPKKFTTRPKNYYPSGYKP